MALPAVTGPLHLALAFGEALPIGIAETLEAVAAAHPRHVADQLAISG